MAEWLILGVLVVGGVMAWRAGWFERLDDMFVEYMEDDDEEDEDA